MTYQPITEGQKQDWIKWLKDIISKSLNGMPETKDNPIFGTPDGDVANAKDITGNLLATLSGEAVTIN